jgi:hypothetical protein
MQDYYFKRKAALMQQHNKMMQYGANVMQAKYESDFINRVIAQTRTEFERLIPEIPYLGGKDNPLTDIIEQMTTLLAFYNVMKRHSITVEVIGEIVYQMANATVEDYPRWIRSLLGRLYMSRFWRNRTKKKALRSQQKQFEGDFVYEVVEGEGDDFEWGVNYLECGVVKYFKQQGADEFTPYMCLIDYLLFPAMGIGLQRTGTIGHGCTHCDFRYKRGGETRSPWSESFWLDEDKKS